MKTKPVETALDAGRRELGPGLTVELAASATGFQARFAQELGPSLVRDSSFRDGPWGPVGDCAYQGAPAGPRALQVAVVPRSDGGRAMRLSATTHSACASTPVGRVEGQVLLAFEARNVEGAPAHVCLWDQTSGRCLANEVVPDQRGWQSLQVLADVPKTARLTLFAYADASIPGKRTVSEYANVDVRPVSDARASSVLGLPTRPTTQTRLVTNSEGFSELWSGPGKHVLVDGIANGWLVSDEGSTTAPRYRPHLAIRAAQWLTLLTCAVVLLFGLMPRAVTRRWSALRDPERGEPHA
jgi:hypothetical protein